MARLPHGGRQSAEPGSGISTDSTSSGIPLSALTSPFVERPLLATIDFGNNGGSAVAVTLGFGDVVYEGTARARGAEESPARLVGEATLRAVEKILGGGHRFELEAVATTDLGSVRVAIAQVVMAGTRESFVGSAVLREGDEAKAAARAALNAINRRLGPLLDRS